MALDEKELLNDAIQTFRTINKSRKVYAVSDIHGDLQAFIVALRDCAQVIRKKGKKIGFCFDKVDKDLDISNLKSFMNVKLTEDNFGGENKLDRHDTDEYKWDLNYEWCGGDSIVVIIGDLIDMYKYPNDEPYNEDNPPNDCEKKYYECEQLELKLIMFINAMNIEAKKIGGEIIKIIGNHEYYNFTDNDDFILKSITPYQRTNPYFNDTYRHEFFNYKNKGFQLYKIGLLYSLIVINDTIFVHGQLTNLTASQHQEINIYLNTIKDYTQKEFDKYHFTLRLFGADLTKDVNGDANAYHQQYPDDYPIKADSLDPDYIKTPESFCEDVQRLINKFNTDIQTDNNKPSRVVIGHCIQQYPLDKNSIKNVFTLNQNTKYKNREIFSSPIIPINYASNINHLQSGFAMECQNDKTDYYKIYKIDVGVSPGNWDNNYIDNTLLNIDDSSEIKTSKVQAYFGQSVPQILMICDDKIVALKSTISNAFINHTCKYPEGITKILKSLKSEKDADVSPPKNLTEYNYFIKYNEDKILENKINNIIDIINCKDKRKYDIEQIEYVKIDCSNRDTDLITKYINSDNIPYIYTCTLTDTKYMNKCISFDKMYDPDAEWLNKEKIYNIMKMTDRLMIYKHNDDGTLCNIGDDNVKYTKEQWDYDYSQFTISLKEFIDCYTYNYETITYIDNEYNNTKSKQYVINAITQQNHQVPNYESIFSSLNSLS